MRIWVCIVGLVCLAGLTACDSPKATPIEAGTEAPKDRAGRYQFGGKREYTNGTEVYYLDTAKGRICYGFITNDGNPDTNSCTDPALLTGQAKGRYQFGGKREYTNGTEVYYLDTVDGGVCYGFITNDSKPDTNRCTDSLAFTDMVG